MKTEENAITVKNVTKIFKLNNPHVTTKLKDDNQNSGFLKALDDISFHVSKGEIMGILGLNGSGKTTLLRIIAGIYKPDFGEVFVNGRVAPLLHLGSSFQGELNARENVIMYGLLLGLKKSEIVKKVHDILEYSELEKFSNMQLKHYSAGMRARLGFSTAMQVDPDILLIDEVLSVGDKIFQKKCFEFFLNFSKNKKIILFTTHNLQFISKYSDRVLLLDKGKIIAIGKPDDIILQYNEMKTENSK